MENFMKKITLGKQIRMVFSGLMIFILFCSTMFSTTSSIIDALALATNTSLNEATIAAKGVNISLTEKISLIEALSIQFSGGLEKGSITDSALQGYLATQANSRDGITEMYFGNANNTLISSSGWTPTEGYTVTSRDWYIGAINTDGIFVTEPYVDVMSGDATITLSKKILSSTNQIMGVLAVDVYLNDIQQLLISIGDANNGHLRVRGEEEEEKVSFF